jgi:hypothetical protein
MEDKNNNSSSKLIVIKLFLYNLNQLFYEAKNELEAFEFHKADDKIIEIIDSLNIFEVTHKNLNDLKNFDYKIFSFKIQYYCYLIQAFCFYKLCFLEKSKELIINKLKLLEIDIENEKNDRIKINENKPLSYSNTYEDNFEFNSLLIKSDLKYLVSLDKSYSNLNELYFDYVYLKCLILKEMKLFNECIMNLELIEKSNIKIYYNAVILHSELLYEDKKVQDSINLLEKYSNLNEDCHRYLILMKLGAIYIKLGQFEKSNSFLFESEKIIINNIDKYETNPDFYNFNMRNLNDDMIGIYLTLSNNYFLLKNFVKSMEYINKCLELDIENDEALIIQANIYYELNNYNQSLESINRCLYYNPYEDKAIELKNKLLFLLNK